METNALAYRPRRRGSLILGLIIAAVSLAMYYGHEEYNPVTGENQRIAISTDDEIALGLQAAPAMADAYGGLDPDPLSQHRVQAVGERVVDESDADNTDWKFNFHLLADTNTVNAFALPGGQVFITRALYDKLNTEGELAAVLAHEIGHVVARHGAEHLAKQQLTAGLTGAAVVASGDQNTGQMAAMIGQMVGLRYGRNDEIEADTLGVRLMADADYDPRAMIRVMDILKKAGGPNRQPEFFSTHPNPSNRITNIEMAIKETFPDGVPEGLRE